jgi:hypothetical protein
MGKFILEYSSSFGSVPAGNEMDLGSSPSSDPLGIYLNYEE